MAFPKLPREVREEILEEVRKKGIKFIRFWFCDLLGVPKSFATPVEELPRAFEEGMWFDGSSISGYQAIEESDMVAFPDPKTFKVVPWREELGRFICDIYYPDERRFECDPRYILKKNLQYLWEKFRMTFGVGAEIEFFVFKNDSRPEPLDRGDFFDFTTLDQGVDFRRELVITLQKMGMRVEHSHHECGPSQHEVTFHYADALTTADNVITYRVAAKEVGKNLDYYVTFMPKPLYGAPGNGMHLHLTLHDPEGRNLFADPADPYGLSELAKKFIAGLIRHIREVCFVIAQWVNSYKRFVPGYEAPAYAVWARANRSAMLRIPFVRATKPESARLEFRTPDPACNPYLAFAAVLRAGLKGIEKDYKVPQPVETNLYSLPRKEVERKGIPLIPETLGEAIKEAERSELLRETLGEKAFQNLLDLKREEWDEFRIQVTEWETNKYYHIL